MQSLDTGSFETMSSDIGSATMRSAVTQSYDYDLFVVGSGPAGQRAAIQAAKLGKRGAVAEMKSVIGGACINTGTIPSKTLREAALHLSGYRERSVYGTSYSFKRRITMADLLYRAEKVIRNEIDVTQHQLQRNHVEMFNARASFIGPHSLSLDLSGNRGRREISAEAIIISVGTQAPWTDTVEFDGQRIFNSDDILGLEDLPATIAIIGAGVIDCEYASIFASLGVRVTLIDKRKRLLSFIDYELVNTLVYHMRQNRLTLRLGEAVANVETYQHRTGERVRINLESGKRINTEKALYAAGRMGNTERLNLDEAGLCADEAACWRPMTIIRPRFRIFMRLAMSPAFRVWRLLAWNRAAMRQRMPSVRRLRVFRNIFPMAFTPFRKSPWSVRMKSSLLKPEPLMRLEKRLTGKSRAARLWVTSLRS